MFCPKCGMNLSDNAQFCARCGYRQMPSSQAPGQARQDAGYAQPTQQQAAFVPARAVYPAQPGAQQGASSTLVDFLADHTPAVIGTAAGVLAILAVALVLYGLGVFGAPAPKQLDSGMVGNGVVNAAEEMPIVVDVNLGKDEKLATPVPVKATGADIHGNQITRTAYINSKGEGLTLPAGRYTVTCLASPVSEKGHLFSVDGVSKTIDVPEGINASSGQNSSTNQLANQQGSPSASAPQSAPVSVSFDLEQEDVHEFTNEELRLVRDYAIESGMPEEEVEDVMAPIEEQVGDIDADEPSEDGDAKEDKSDEKTDSKSGKSSDKATDDSKDSGDKSSGAATAPLPGEDASGSDKSADKPSDGQDKPATQASTTVFGPSQLYKGKLYVGDVRTMGGDKPVTLIPKSEKPPVQAEQFLFVDGMYYYVENFQGNGSGAVKLHKYNLQSKKDDVLAEDVLAPSKVSYADGKIVYQMKTDSGVKVKVVDPANGDSALIDFGDRKGLNTFVGVVDGKAIVTSSLYGEPTYVLGCEIAGGEVGELFSLSTDESVVAVHEGKIITVDKKKIAALDKTGTKIWSSELPTETVSASTAHYADGAIWFSESKLDDSNDIVSISLSDGKAELYQTGLPHSIQVLYVDSKTAYFCAEPIVGSGEMAPNGFYTYALNLADKSLTRLDDEKAAGAAEMENKAQRVTE